jgi:hypothetical protein
VWISIVNFSYLLTQMVIAVDDVSVRTAAGRVVSFVRRCLREVAGVFGIVLLLVGIATVGSILATAGLGVIAFVPFLGLAVLPLQVAGWLLRGFVFQYVALTALSAYLRYYRHDQHGSLQPPAQLVDASDHFPGRAGAAGARVLRSGLTDCS